MKSASLSSNMGPALRLFACFTILLGGGYPVLVTALAQLGFAPRANGSWISLAKDGRIVGSELIAQKFEKPGHFWPRPSAVDYNPMPSGGSNWGPTSQDLLNKVTERKNAGLTLDLLFASASGLDPHISPAAATAQVERISRATGVKTERLSQLVEAHTEGRQLGFLGEPRVNVLKLNLALDQIEVYKH